MLLACSAINNYAEDSQAAFDRNFLTGPEYMPEVMDPVTAPFDVNGISRPVFAERTTTVKMNKRGLSTRQIQTAIDRMSRQGGGTVVIPDGQWTSGRIELKSGVCLHLSDGQEGRPVLLPMTVAPVNCKNILIEGITLDQGLFWNIVPQYCDNVIIRGVTVNSAGHGRTDGIDIDSTTNALIEYCTLDCGDDCYTIKSGRGEDGVKTARPSANIVIRHSVALRGGAHDVWVERVYAKDIKWNGLTVDMLGSKKWVGELANRFPARQVNELTPEFKNIYIKDFTVDGCQRLIDVKALPERPLTNVLIENFEGHGIDFLRLQDVSGFVMKGGKIHTAAPSAVLDGCQSVMLLDMD